MSKPTDVPDTENDNPEGLKLPVAVFGTETAQPSDFPVYEEVPNSTPAASPVAPPENAGYEPEKRCCTVCDAKKLCHVCGQPTLYACSDCRIDFGVSIYVCPTKECRMAHEAKCSAVLIARANPSAEGDGR